MTKRIEKQEIQEPQESSLEPDLSYDSSSGADDLDESEMPTAEWYDSDLDDKDEEWAKRKIIPGSDAILSCPLCFAVVCRDCQRHTKYTNQYRAMFTVNCTVARDQKLISAGDTYYSVQCNSCSCELGLQDMDEVFHLFNIIAE